MKTPLKDLGIYVTHGLAKAYSLTICMAQSNLVRQLLEEKLLTLQFFVSNIL
jgi:hypothetical protein